MKRKIPVRYKNDKDVGCVFFTGTAQGKGQGGFSPPPPPPTFKKKVSINRHFEMLCK